METTFRKIILRSAASQFQFSAIFTLQKYALPQQRRLAKKNFGLEVTSFSLLRMMEKSYKCDHWLPEPDIGTNTACAQQEFSFTPKIEQAQINKNKLAASLLVNF